MSSALGFEAFLPWIWPLRCQNYMLLCYAISFSPCMYLLSCFFEAFYLILSELWTNWTLIALTLACTRTIACILLIAKRMCMFKCCLGFIPSALLNFFSGFRDVSLLQSFGFYCCVELKNFKLRNVVILQLLVAFLILVDCEWIYGFSIFFIIIEFLAAWSSPILRLSRMFFFVQLLVQTV